MNKKFDEIKNFIEMATSKKNKKDFNDEMVKKTMEYQKKYGFELNSRPKHELWNVEADAFKHAFGSADMAFDMGSWGSVLGGIFHELTTKNNPPGEWNMDSWNNNQGREIAKEIKKEYGNKFYKLSEKEKDDAIAEKIMQRMRSGQLITNPSDTRKYKGFWEEKFNNSKPTGQAAPIQKIFSPEDIGNMSTDEFAQNETLIMNQLKNGQINFAPKNFSKYINPKSGTTQIFSREDISNMSTNEYSKYEPEIMAQLNSIGIPTENDLKNSSGTVYIPPYTRRNGTFVKGYYRSK